MAGLTEYLSIPRGLTCPPLVISAELDPCSILGLTPTICGSSCASHAPCTPVFDRFIEIEERLVTRRHKGRAWRSANWLRCAIVGGAPAPGKRDLHAGRLTDLVSDGMRGRTEGAGPGGTPSLGPCPPCRGLYRAVLSEAPGVEWATVHSHGRVQTQTPKETRSGGLTPEGIRTAHSTRTTNANIAA